MDKKTKGGLLLALLATIGVGGAYLLLSGKKQKFKAGDKLKATADIDVYKAAGQPRYGVYHAGNFIGTVQGYNSNGNWLIIADNGGLWVPVLFEKNLVLMK